MERPLDLSAKNVLITGGSMGIGFAVARECLQRGARVLICARDGAKVREAVGELAGVSGRENVGGIVADVSDRQQVDAALDELVKRFGAITSLIHAAAVQGPIGDITAVDPQEWLDTVRIDLFGCFLMTRQACARMKKSGGRIVLFAGGGAAAPLPDFTAYACSKAGVVRFAETAASEMTRFGIEINALAPGLVATRMSQRAAEAGRAPQAKAVPPTVAAKAAAFLISDRARGITGKFVAAPYDGWAEWTERLDALRQGDIFTLRRILPRDRGMDWQ